METFLTIVCLGAIGILLYTYLGFPFLVYVINRFAGEKEYIEEAKELPSVTIITAAYNEERYIERKTRNALDVDYPAQKLQVIVASDGSDDNTMKILSSIEDNKLKVIDIKERKGKANALNHALSEATGEIIVFTDANVFFERDAVKALASYFVDEKCGAASGVVELTAIDSAEPLGEGAYMKYERFIQKQESSFSSMVGTDGGMFAARKALVDNVPQDIVLDDMYIVLKILEKGYLIRYANNARATELVPASVQQEFRRKVRISAGGFQILDNIKWKEFPARTKLSFVSHKIFRWLTPVFQVVAYFTNYLLIGKSLFFIIFILHSIFYVLALLGAVAKPLRNNTVVYVSYYFCAMSLASLLGYIKYLRGSQKVTWNRVDR